MMRMMMKGEEAEEEEEMVKKEVAGSALEAGKLMKEMVVTMMELKMLRRREMTLRRW